MKKELELYYGAYKEFYQLRAINISIPVQL